jgi:molybdopterin synthase catalytic subunit
VADGHLTVDPIDPASTAVSIARSGDGAVATFTGIVRNHHDGRAVLWLEYEAYEEMAERRIDLLIAEAFRRWPISQVAMRHRLGHLVVGDVSVTIAVAAPHRAEALDACGWLIDTLKAEVPIFKKEAYAGGGVWVDDREGGRIADR